MFGLNPRHIHRLKRWGRAAGESALVLLVVAGIARTLEETAAEEQRLARHEEHRALAEAAYRHSERAAEANRVHYTAVSSGDPDLWARRSYEQAGVLRAGEVLYTIERGADGTPAAVRVPTPDEAKAAAVNSRKRETPTGTAAAGHAARRDPPAAGR